MTLLERYEWLCRRTDSAISEHLPTLRRYAEQCNVICELGVDIGQSTTAFLAAQPAVLYSVDLALRPEVRSDLLALDPFYVDDLNVICARIARTLWLYRMVDSSRTPAIPCDLLFIDTAHHYDQVAAELSINAPNVRRWIALHDTVSFGEQGEGGLRGILPAIRDFLAANPAWQEREHHTNNNGLMILERTP